MELKSLVKPYQIFPADNGGIRFKLVTRAELGENVKIKLLAKECPHEDLITILFGRIPLINVETSEGSFDFGSSIVLDPDSSYEFCLSWFNKKLCLTNVNVENKFLKLVDIIENKLIGYVKFYLPPSTDVIVGKHIAPLKPLSYKHIEGGQLHWVSFNGSSDDLPLDALIGGFEDGETIYIALANHGGSQCVGKYVRSKGCAFVPWGHLEHRKEDFKILCGYNAMWMKCKENFIPENVFIAGRSEVHNEYLYVGRAMIGSDLIVGKVHALYKACFLPYKGEEQKKYKYEILVRGDVRVDSFTNIPKCSLNPMNALQPCI